jgi:hypothetical protein
MRLKVNVVETFASFGRYRRVCRYLGGSNDDSESSLQRESTGDMVDTFGQSNGLEAAVKKVAPTDVGTTLFFSLPAPR